MFTDKQKDQLEAPLLAHHVSKRRQGTSGPMLSYIEGWHAIAEANRIFGFHAWQRRTIQLECVASNKAMMGKDPNRYEGWTVSYIARVEVIVTTADADVIHRHGTGAGHGRDRDPGLAHESAVKEAETDAMKRALMTFGNPFGLALYDKEQSNVSDVDLARLDEFRDAVDVCETELELNQLIAEYNTDIVLLRKHRNADWRVLNDQVTAKRASFKEAE